MKPDTNPLMKLSLRVIIGALVIGNLIIGVAALLATSGGKGIGCAVIPGISQCAEVKIPSSDVVADFYKGDQLVAAGVSSVNISVFAGQSVRINIRNVKELNPDSFDSYIYEDTFIDIQVPSGQSKTFVITPQKIYHKGLLRLSCTIVNRQIGDDIFCQPVIDGIKHPTLEDGATTTYALEPGEHALHMELVGADIALWYPAADDKTISILAGDETDVIETFNKKTLLVVTLDQPSVVGDLYLDGVLIGDQVALAEAWVQPEITYEISGTNFTDPNALGLYEWDNVEVEVAVGYEGRKSVRLTLLKEDIAGVASVICSLAGWTVADSVQCSITVDDGDPIAEITPGQPAEIKLKPGVHNLAITLIGKDAPKWQQPPRQRISIRTGQTVNMAFSADRVVVSQADQALTPIAPPPSLFKATLSGFGANARAIFQKGRALQRDSHRFSKVGDCETESPYFLIPFDDGLYDLGDYTYLRAMVPYFAGSFKYQGQAGRGSFVAASVLDSTWADPNVCQPGETPLACEYRTRNPAFALIMLRTYPYPWEAAQRDKYISDMRSVINYTIQQGIVPIVSTIPLIENSPNELQDMNAIIRQLAGEYQIPLWDFYATTSTLPNNGVKDSHLTVPPVGATFFNDPEALQYGMPRRNLEALQVLYSLYVNVMR